MKTNWMQDYWVRIPTSFKRLQKINRNYSQKKHKLFLATLFGRIFLRDPPGRRNPETPKDRIAQQELDKKKSNFLHHFLINDQSDFVFAR